MAATLVWYSVARASFRRNLAYLWAHMANNAGSLLFGLIYMALWQAAARGRQIGPFPSRELVSYVALSQVVLWISTFLPADLGISDQVRTGQVALEMARPVGYLPRMLAAGVGESTYNLIFRSGPLALMFTGLGVFPWSFFQSEFRTLEVVLALAISAWIGILFQYLIGISAFWTIRTRWARRLYFGLTMFCGGQLLPLQIMPPALRDALTWMPFQALISLPCSVWLKTAQPAAWVSASLWTVVLYGIAWWVTRIAHRRVEIQGG